MNFSRGPVDVNLEQEAKEDISILPVPNDRVLQGPFSGVNNADVIYLRCLLSHPLLFMATYSER